MALQVVSAYLVTQ